jgi:DNA-binding MarR family transcriptional regulator/GNAT superfamily N-acetyltransferase
MSAIEIAAVRHFNRLYTERLGILDERWLGGTYPLPVVRVMLEIAHAEGITASAIAERLRLDPGYLSRILASLTDEGLILREPAAEDRRQRLLTLTKKGRKTFAELDRRQSDDIASILAPLPASSRTELVASMQTCARLLGQPFAERELDTPTTLRDPAAGDLGWIVHRHGVLYDEYGWGPRFEGLVAGVVSDFAANADPKTERCWIAERGGERLGSIMVTRADREATTRSRTHRSAKLRLLLVEPSARGLGLGTRLVDEAIGFATRAGYEKMQLWTADVLHDARRIYERAGFELTCEERGALFGAKTKEQTWELELGAPGRRRIAVSAKKR